jgi:DNA polymerase (family 10)
MTNVEISALFEELADLMELAGENHFKVRAYRNAATTIASQGRPLAEMAEDEIRGLTGIGEAIAGKIGTALATGTFPTLEKWRQSRRASLRPIARLDGIGTRKLRVMIEDLNIESIEDLKKTMDQKRLDAYKKLEINSKKAIKEYLKGKHG